VGVRKAFEVEPQNPNCVRYTTPSLFEFSRGEANGSELVDQF